MTRLLTILSLLSALVALAGCGTARPRHTASPSANVAAPARDVVNARSRARVHHYEYVFPDEQMDVYDIDHGFALVQHVALPGIDGIRGVAFAPRTGVLYISHGGDSGGNGNGSLLAYDLRGGRTIWDRAYPFGIDSMAISRNGKRIYMPDGELADNGFWYVLDAGSGAVRGRIDAGSGPHNTVVSLNGRHVYLGGRDWSYLEVASTRSGRIVKRIGPLESGVRPFTINGRETLAFTTATGFLGFQVSSIRSGHVLYTQTFGPRFTWNPSDFSPSAPSHGISLTPDERQLWVIDAPNSYVHAFDVTRLPRRRPRAIADVKLPDSISGEESGCSYDCTRDGWLQTSTSGCYVFVGDSGDVLSTRSFKPVAFLPGLRESRKMLEIDWRAGRPFATSTRIGVGTVRHRRRPPRPRCP